MSNETLVTADELIEFGIYFEITENLHDIVRERFTTTNQEGIEKYDFEGLSVDEVTDYCLNNLDWYKIWSESIFDLFYLFLIKLLHNYFDIPYRVIIKDIIPLYDEFIDFNKTLHKYREFQFNSEFLNLEYPSELIEVNLNNKKSFYQDFILSKKTFIQASLFDAVIGFILNFLEFDNEPFISFLKNYSHEIEEKELSIDDLLESGLIETLENLFGIDIYSIFAKYEDLIANCYPGYKGGNNFLDSLISRVQFKYIMDAILIEEIPKNYTAESCKEKAFLCNVCDRSGWYTFKVCDLPNEKEWYHFNPQYSTTICIALPTNNKEEKIFITGLYHWKLQLLSLDVPDGRSLMLHSPERECWNEKDFLEIKRYLQEMESKNNEEE